MNMMSKEYVNPPSLFNSKQYGFSQAVITPAGSRTVYFSGQAAFDENEQIIGGDDLELQTDQTLKNLQIAVRSAGGELSDIVMLHIYMVPSEPEVMDIVGSALRKYFGVENPPASSWIGVASLARPEFLIEIEATASI
jgi:enamine deaminase RidA (YjgF/YER057c/UK114 family)